MQKRTALFFMICFLSVRLAHADESEQLRRVKEKLEKERKNLKALISKKSSILDMLDQIDQRITKVAQEDKRLHADVEDREGKINEIEKKMQAKNQELASTRNQVSKRVVALYKLGEVGPLKILFSSQSVADLMSRNYQLSLVIQNDLKMIRLFHVQLASLHQLRDQLKEEKDLLEHASVEAEKTRARLLAEKEQRAAVLEVIGNEEEIHKHYIAELEQASKKLEELLENLAARKRKGLDDDVVDRGFAARKGSLKPPLRGRVIKKWGKVQDEKFYTYQFNKGIEIRSAYAAQVRAVYDGKVVFSGWFKGFGQMIIVDHGGGFYTLSAHNQELLKRTGEPVEEGEVIGRLSDAHETTEKGHPTLYFEVREHGNSLNPLLWLAQSGFM